MTGTTDAETAEIAWGASEQGKTAVRAAWARWEQIRRNAPDAALPGIIFVDEADIREIVFAAHQACTAGECDRCGEDRDHMNHIVTAVARGGHEFAAGEGAS